MVCEIPYIHRPLILSVYKKMRTQTNGRRVYHNGHVSLGQTNTRWPNKKGFYSSYHLFIIKILKNKKGLNRDDLFNYLYKKKIQTNVHYIPIHTHPFYRKLGFKSKNFPNAENYIKNCLSLPMHAALNFSDQNKVINQIKKFFKWTFQ